MAEAKKKKQHKPVGGRAETLAERVKRKREIEQARLNRPLTGAVIRQLRKAVGLSLAEVAADLGVTKGALTGWESGRSPLPDDKYPQFEQYFGVTSQDDIDAVLEDLKQY